MRPFTRNDHDWSQRHLSHYVEGELGWLARRRLELHAEDCVDCGRGIRALRTLIRLLHASAEESPAGVAATPVDMFSLVRADAVRDGDQGGSG